MSSRLAVAKRTFLHRQLWLVAGALQVFAASGLFIAMVFGKIQLDLWYLVLAVLCIGIWHLYRFATTWDDGA